MSDTDEQLILNLDLVDSLKVLSIYKKLADEIVELKQEVQHQKEQRYSLTTKSAEVEEELEEVKEKNKELKKQLVKLSEPVFNVDCRCDQFRVKVGYSYIHDILTTVFDMDLDGYDDDDDDSGKLKCVEEQKDFLFTECAGAINTSINRFICDGTCEEINNHMMDEIGNVVQSFQDKEYITQDD